MPKLAGGPASGTQIARVQLLQQLVPLLPLPTSTLNAETNQLTINDKEIEVYVQRLFSPFDHANLAPGLPDLLRKFADHLDKAK